MGRDRIRAPCADRASLRQDAQRALPPQCGSAIVIAWPLPISWRKLRRAPSSASMGPHWQQLAGPPAQPGLLFMDAELRPHRSLSQRAFALVLGGFALMDGAITTAFL